MPKIHTTLLVLAVWAVPVFASLRSCLPAANIKASIERGTRWLTAQQNPDGGYGPYGEQDYLRLKNTSDVGITAFALYAIAKDPAGYKAATAPFVSRAVDFLMSRQQDDGGFYDKKDPTLQNYKTCVVLLALSTLDRVKYANAINKAHVFIKAQQFNEEDGYKPNEHLGYGGLGYGSKLRPDLSNSQFSLEALAESGLSGSDELWKRAVVFIGRCQNAKSVDPLLKDLRIGTTADGGYRYAPDDTRGPTETLDDGARVFSSYGSMTYAALKSLLYANVNRSDPMIQDAFAWISKNYAVKENPGMATRLNPKAGLEGLYYYYHTMAKALSLYGEPVIKDGRGVEHRWAKELSDHLISLQHEEGFWQNTSERWYENISVLDTSYAIVALVECAHQIAKAPPSPSSKGGEPAAKAESGEN